MHTGAVDARALGLEEARALVGELSAALAARELQLERKQQEVAGMQDVQQRLMARPDSALMCPGDAGWSASSGGWPACRTCSSGSWRAPAPP